ncbi:MAG: hypothetical protein SFU99_11995 [Saprospiraceae bacterium]|nr:hypothetical protein [Saprospiraceae bacterium]
MKNIIKTTILFLVFTSLSCDQEIIERIDEFSLEQGGYMRTVTPFPVSNTTFKVSKANMAGSKWEFVAEAVTSNFGANFESYDWVVKFVDATAANGTNNVANKNFKSFPASVYTKDAVTGYPRATLGSTGKELMDALGLTDEQVAAGDRFEITATMRLKDGKSFNATNSDPDITGGAFYSSPFAYRVNVVD